MTKQREFDFKDKHFSWLKNKVMEHAGIALSDQKKDLVYGRLARRLRALGLSNFDDYCDLLKSDNDEEMIEFINSITTNLTSFFREKHHFDYLKSTAIKYLLDVRKKEKRIRIWSAGCSTGEEAYTIAITILESVPNINDWDIKILATDIDTNVLKTGREGVYDSTRMSGIDEKYFKKWFLKSKDSDLVKVNSKLSDLITFNKLNLMEDWPMRGQFDVLFCRNVVIYFNNETKRVLFDRFANILKHDGFMFVGHSENLNKITDRFTLIGNTIHKKAA